MEDIGCSLTFKVWMRLTGYVEAGWNRKPKLYIAYFHSKSWDKFYISN